MKKTILSLEQALTLPYTTQRFAQLGWRVIRIESPGVGDPNRRIGEDTGEDDLHAYFIAPNIGKEAITLNLKELAGQELLKKIIRELNVDVFLCNTLPKRYKQLGIDYDTLKEANPDLIWCGISAFGPDRPGSAGYDPALQAFTGYMFLTGEPDRDPMLCGLPVIDLKAGDEAFNQVLLAMLEQYEKASGEPGGKEIFISMAQCAASWLITALPQLEFVENESELFTRSGNEHRSFIPCNCYKTRDGYVYLAIGNDLQWDKLTKIPGFEPCAALSRVKNAGRLLEKDAIYEDIRKGLQNYTTAEFLDICTKLNLAVAPVNSVKDVAELDIIDRNMLKTVLPSGKTVKLFPTASGTDFLDEQGMTMKCAPKMGQDNAKVFGEAGLSEDEIGRLRDEGIV